MPLNKPSSSMLNAGSSNAPQNLGATPSAGTGPDFSFSDHVHQRPTATEVGAISSTEKGAASGVASLDGSARLNAVQMPAITGDVVIAAGTTTSKVEKIQNLSVPVPTASGTMLQFADGLLLWGAAPSGGSGGGGIVMFFNNGTTGDIPLTGLPTLTGGAIYKELRRVAETNQTTLTSPTLTSSYTNIAGFITDVNDPETVEITAGLWDFNVWAVSSNGGSLVRASLYKYNGTTGSSTLLATSSGIAVPTVAGQLGFSLIIPQTTIELTDRIAVIFEALNAGNNHTVTLQFGGSTPSHVHTTLPSIGKTGVPKVINGVVQPDASLIKNEDLSPDAAIEQSKIAGLTDVLNAKAKATQIDVFTTVGTSTWTKPAGAKAVELYVIGGGAGGGSGCSSPNGTAAGGGTGGGGGGRSFVTIDAAFLNATETITVGNGGPGGASRAAESGNGNPGTSGSASSFGLWVYAGGGTQGSGGTSAATPIPPAGGGSTRALFVGAGGGAVANASGAQTFGNGGAGGNATSGCGGGAGGGVSAGGTVANGGSGGFQYIYNGGSVGPTPVGQNGFSVPTNLPYGGAAGGGGNASKTAAAMSGGNGGLYGGGGGGGGAGQGFDSGAGGAGAQGIVVVITHF